MISYIMYQKGLSIYSTLLDSSCFVHLKGGYTYYYYILINSRIPIFFQKYLMSLHRYIVIHFFIFRALKELLFIFTHFIYINIQT